MEKAAIQKETVGLRVAVQLVSVSPVTEQASCRGEEGNMVSLQSWEILEKITPLVIVLGTV